jgi:high frequency lysogenization protein
LEILLQDHYEKIAVALAGMIQAIALVRELAQTGKMPEEAFNASVYSLFQTNPSHVACVYGDLQGIKWGLEKLLEQIGPTPDRTLSRYMLSVIHLQKKLFHSQKLVAHLTQRLNQIKKQVGYFSLTHPTVITNLADVYMNTISVFRFRIIIWGNQRVLNAHANMEKIRALLLAGIRSAVLWRQVGGSRSQLLLSRTKIRRAATKLLADLKATSVL